MDLVELSRLQFAATAMFHFLFVPLTLGLVWILFIMESVYVMTGRVIYKDMTRFWGKLFTINFALGVTTGLTLEFQFGTNWAYYSHYVGDIFGTPLAMEGLMAFFLESTFLGLFLFGWDRMSKRQHWLATLLLAIGTNLSALWILVANGWMQNPVGAEFNFETMRMELTNFAEIFLNHEAQNKFVHTVSAGYVTGSMFVLSVSAWYLLKKQHIDFAKKSFRIATSFGVASVLSVIVLGDESGFSIAHVQETKLAALEAMWETEPAPASFNLLAKPNEATMRNDWEIRIPWLMGLIGTRSLTKEIPGIVDLVEKNEQRIISGQAAVSALERLRANREDAEALAVLRERVDDLGYGLLLKAYRADVAAATPEELKQAARATVPQVTPMFWAFRIMVGTGFLLLLLFTWAMWASVKGDFVERPCLLRCLVLALPLPWIACEVGWFVAEYGRQPWSIYGILPTQLSVSSLSAQTVYASLSVFVIFYSILLIIEMFLMFRYIRLGPGSLGTGRYVNDAAQYARRS